MIKIRLSTLLFFLVLSITACTEKHPSKTAESATQRSLFDSLLSKSKDTSNHQRNQYANQSLNLAKKLQNDSLIAKAFIAKYSLLREQKPDSILPFLKSHGKYANDKTYLTNLALAQGMMGDYYQGLGKFDSAFLYYTAAKQNHENKKDTLMAVYRQLLISGIYLQYNDYIGLESSAAEGMALLNNPNDISYNPTIYNYLGIAAKNLNNTSDAVKYYKSAAAIATDSVAKIIILNNLAVVLRDNGEYAKAETMLNELNDSPAIDKDPATKARVQSNLGKALFLQGKPGGVELLLESEQVRKKINDLPGLVASQIHLAEALLENNRSKAHRFALEAYKNATLINSTDDRLEALQHVIKTAAPDRTSPYYSTYLRLEDSISNVRQTAKNQFAKIRYDFRKFKDDNLKLKAADAEKALELEKRQRRNDVLIFIIVIILSVAILIYAIIRTKHQKEKQQQRYIAETRISKIVHDELANDVFHTMAFAETQDLASSVNKETLLNRLDTIYGTTRNISREHATIDTGIAFAVNLKESISSYNSDHINVVTAGFDDIDWNAIKPEKKIVLYRVVQELLVNMKKHSQCSVAVFSFGRWGNGMTLSYSDNGIGVANDAIFLKNGLANVESRIRDINGTVTFENATGTGFKARIAFPV